jgi:hypothetical protein
VRPDGKDTKWSLRHREDKRGPIRRFRRAR